MTIGEKLEESKNRLDTLLTYANGVTRKNDPNIGDAVKTLADGYGKGSGIDWLQYITRSENGIFADTDIPGENGLHFDMKNCKSFSNFLRNTNTHGNIRISAATKPTSMYCCFYYTNTKGPIFDVTIDVDMSKSTQFRGMFNQCPYVRNIYGNPIDFSSITEPYNGADSVFGNCPNLENVRFAPNCMRFKFGIPTSPKITTDTLVSAANCLREDAGNNQFALHATAKANCANIIGNSVLDDTGTYHVFVQDENGEMSLSDFITNVKGWILA